VSDAVAVRDALTGAQWAFDEARRRRIKLVQRLGTLRVAPELQPTRDTLARALLAREALATDERRSLATRTQRIAAQDERAAAAAARLTAAGERRAEPLLEAIAGQWTWAFDQADRLTRGLDGRAPAEVVGALRTYYGTLRRAHETREPDVAGIEAAQQALEETLARALSG
jgi:hypothetical protein